jgi:hypothetical protein
MKLLVIAAVIVVAIAGSFGTADARVSSTGWTNADARAFNRALGRPTHPAYEGGILCDPDSRKLIICTDSYGPRLGAIYLTRLAGCRMSVELGFGSPLHTRRALSRAGLVRGAQRIPAYVGC